MPEDKQYRDAGTGEYVTASAAEADPDGTVAETRKATRKAKHDTTIGKVVHYVSYGTPNGEYTSQCRAAIITEVNEEEPFTVSLCVLNPTGQFFNENVKYSSSLDGGTWHHVL